MIVSKCSTRISLAGGSTDLQPFLDKYDYGKVISFPCDIFSYITLFQDKYGYNKQKRYIVNYTRREEVDELKDIRNDIARVVLEYFNCKHITLSFHSDVFSAGSGLASSTAYLIACIKSVSLHMGKVLSHYEICNLALELERKFNPLTGYQDVYGCGLDGFKMMTFHKDGLEDVHQYNIHFLNSFDIYLRPTGITRNSTEILSSVDVDKSKEQIQLVDDLCRSIERVNKHKFLDVINHSWYIKKLTSPLITENEKIKTIDEELANDDDVLAHKLCGAGNGGFFLLFKNKESEQNPLDIKISPFESPLSYKEL